jgi:hypothetical protein
MTQTLHLHSRIHRRFRAQPLTYGVPWPPGQIRSIAELALTDERGEALPAAFTLLNCWPDGSVQWSLVDFMLDFEPSGQRVVSVVPDAQRGTAPNVANPVNARIADEVCVIENGLVEVVGSARAGTELIRSWRCGAGGRKLLKDGGFDIAFTAGGQRYSARQGPRRISIEHSNPLRAILRIDGKHADGQGRELLDYFLRIEVRANRPDVQLTYSFRNREMPTPGIEVQSFYARFDTAVGPRAKRCFTANNLTRHYLPGLLRIDEDPQIIASDTGDLENYQQTHKDGQRADCYVHNPEVLHDPPEQFPWFLRDQKFRLLAGGNKCVWPYLALVDESIGGIIAAFGAMTTLHPKSLQPCGEKLEFGIYPDWAGPLKITQGAGRSHVMFIAPVEPAASDLDIQSQYLGWEYGGIYPHQTSLTPIEIRPDKEHVRRCGVFAIDKLPTHDPQQHFSFERKLLNEWIGVNYGQLGLADQVKYPVATGFWNFGDNGKANNEEMHALAYFQNHLRSGNWGCAEMALAAATHMMEVDHCAFSVDPFQNGGMVAHCLNHNDGAAYPSHMWFTELLIAYALTGDAEYKAAALRACDCLLFWIHDEQGFKIVSADQREAGQPIINLTWCYQFNRDPRYLEACRRIIRDVFISNTEKYGRMLDAKPQSYMPMEIVSYGDYAAWEGMFWFWQLTQDAGVRDFMLSQLDWRLSEDRCATHAAFHRTIDYNPAAYAYYLSGGDKRWLERVIRPFRAAFRASKWSLGWVHSMYYIKLAFDHGLIRDEDVLVG